MAAGVTLQSADYRAAKADLWAADARGTIADDWAKKATAAAQSPPPVESGGAAVVQPTEASPSPSSPTALPQSTPDPATTYRNQAADNWAQQATALLPKDTTPAAEPAPSPDLAVASPAAAPPPVATEPPAAPSPAPAPPAASDLPASPPAPQGIAIPDWLQGLIQKYAPPALAGDPHFLATVAAGAKAESGWNPQSVQQGGGGRGLFQFDVNGGMGTGLGPDQLFNADYQASKIVPMYAAMFQQAPADLSPAEQASWVAAHAERPYDYQNPGSTARRNYAAAYNEITAGGAPAARSGGPAAGTDSQPQGVATPAPAQDNSNPLQGIGDALGGAVQGVGQKVLGLTDWLTQLGRDPTDSELSQFLSQAQLAKQAETHGMTQAAEQVGSTLAGAPGRISEGLDPNAPGNQTLAGIASGGPAVQNLVGGFSKMAGLPVPAGQTPGGQQLYSGGGEPQELTPEQKYAFGRSALTAATQTLVPEDIIARAATTGVGSLAKSGEIAQDVLASKQPAQAPIGFASGGLTNLGQKSATTLERAAGTPEQAAQLRPGQLLDQYGNPLAPSAASTAAAQPIAGTAGNILLDKFPEEVRPLLSDAVQTFNEFAGQRRGVISDPQAMENAAQKGLGMTVEDFLKTKPGTAFNQETALALGQTLTKTGQDLDALIHGGTASPAQIAEKALQFGALAGVRAGSAAEAGRTLRAFSTRLTGAGASDEQAIRAAFTAMGTDPAKFGDWVTAWKMTDPTDTMGRYKLLQAVSSRDPTIMDKVLAFGMSNILSSTKTWEVIGLHTPTQTLNRPLLELLRDGDPAAAATDIAAMGRATGRAMSNAAQAFLTGTGPEGAATAMQGGLENLRQDAFPGKQGLIATPALRVISALREFTQTLVGSGAMAVAARRESAATGRDVADLLANPTATMLSRTQEAIDQAMHGGKASLPAQALLNMRNQATQGTTPGAIAGGLITHVLVPFVRFPDYVLRSGIKMTAGPVAYPTIGAGHLIQGGITALRGNPAEAARLAGLAAGDFRVGAATAAVATAIWAEAVNGNITGGGPTDPAQQATLENARDAQGNPLWQAHSIHVGGRWYDYTTMAGPFAVPMAAISSAVEAYRMGDAKGLPDDKVAMQVASATVRALLDVSYIRGLADIFKAIGSGTMGNLPASTAASIAERFIPYGGAINEGTRGLDPTTKDYTGMPYGGLPERIEARIPGLSQNVPAKLDPLGEPVQAPQDFLSTATPGRSAAPVQTPSGPILAAFANAGLSVAAAPKEITVSGAPVALQPEEQRTYQQALGHYLEQEAPKVLNDPRYQNASPAEQTYVLGHLLNVVRQAASNTVLKQMDQADLRQRLSGGQAMAQQAHPALAPQVQQRGAQMAPVLSPNVPLGR